MTGLFVTGTDTGVGKTVAAAALLSLMRSGGSRAVPMKPVQTGCEMRDGRLSAPDGEFCAAMAGAEWEEEMSPHRFEPACSPHLAAQRAGVEVSLGDIAGDFDRLSKRYDAVVVEGAGGILVPISNSRTMLDLMMLLKLPVVLVARLGLGTLNHTLLSLRELRRARLEVRGVVFCDTTPVTAGYIETDNRTTVANLGDVRLLAHLPFLPGLADGACSPAAFRRWSEEHLPTAFAE